MDVVPLRRVAPIDEQRTIELGARIAMIASNVEAHSALRRDRRAACP